MQQLRSRSQSYYGDEIVAGDTLAKGGRSAQFGPPLRKLTDEEYQAMFEPDDDMPTKTPKILKRIDGKTK